MKKIILLLSIALIVTIISSGCSDDDATTAPAVQENIELSTNYQPWLVHLTEDYAAIYELYITDYRALGWELEKAEILANNSTGNVIAEYTGIDLDTLMHEPARGIIDFMLLFYLNFEELADVPDSLYHRLTFNSNGRKIVKEGGTATINKAAPIVLAPPVRGENWMAANGPASYVDHRKAVFEVVGKIYVAQRYAIDWVKYGPNGFFFEADGMKNSEHFAYDQNIYAVADGIVVDAKDNIPDNTPPEAPTPTFARLAGNYIMLQMDNGYYAFYAHLIPGSLQVKIGDEVKKGDVIAKLGNTGNSTGPHLHFHVCDGIDKIFSEGVPYVIDNFVYEGYDSDYFVKHDGGIPWQKTVSEPMQNKLPSDGVTVSFE